MRSALSRPVRFLFYIATLSISGAAIGQTASNDDRRETSMHEHIVWLRRTLGDRAGIPNENDVFVRVPAKARWLSRQEAEAALTRAVAEIERERWWTIGLDPTKLNRPLRDPAQVVSGCAAAVRAALSSAERCLVIAKEAAAFLRWAQTQGGTGGFPFPASPEGRSRAFGGVRSTLDAARRSGRLNEVVRNGWATDDGGNGGLQFDNGEAGLAMLDLYEVTGEEKYLASAKKAADWAIGQPIVTNWNYNSFSVALLARAYAATTEPRYLTAALSKANDGILPAQLLDGPNSGRWIDGHNARAVYHYVIVRNLALLVSSIPQDHLSKPQLLNTLRLALQARNRDFAGLGVPTKNMAMEALLLITRRFPAAELQEPTTETALNAISKLVSEQSRRGHRPLDPKAWIEFLAYSITRDQVTR